MCARFLLQCALKISLGVWVSGFKLEDERRTDQLFEVQTKRKLSPICSTLGWGYVSGKLAYT